MCSREAVPTHLNQGDFPGKCFSISKANTKVLINLKICLSITKLNHRLKFLL